MNKSRLLMTEQPIIINKELAKIIGLNEAIVLQQIEYWININKQAKKENSYQDEFYWTYNTVEDWQEEFPFWSFDTVKRTLTKLRGLDVLITGRFNKKGFDRTLWYRINYEILDKIDKDFYTIRANCTNEENQHLQDEKTIKPLQTDNSAKCPVALVQNAPNNTRDLPEITTSSSSTVQNTDLTIDFKDNICELKKTTLIKFNDLVLNHDIDFVKAIIEECNVTTVKSYRGFEVAFNSYVARDCKTREDVILASERYRADRKEKKSKKPNTKNTYNKKPDTFNNYEQRSYNFSVFERVVAGEISYDEAGENLYNTN